MGKKYECPICEKGFATDNQIKFHTNICDIRICTDCGGVLKSHNYQKHREQYHGDIPGVNTKHYGNPHFTLTCDNCSTKIERSITDINKNNYCSEKCYHIDSRDELVKFQCDYCDKTQKRKPSRYDVSEKHFCDRSCTHKYLREKYDTSDRLRYGPTWNANRRKALERDNYSCVECGKTKSDIGREPDVHHIIPRRLYFENYDEPECYIRANRVDNLISLCRTHHSKWEGIPLRPDTS